MNVLDAQVNAVVPPQRYILGSCTSIGKIGFAARYMPLRWRRFEMHCSVVVAASPAVSSSMIVVTLPPHRFLKSVGLSGSGSIVMCRSSSTRVSIVTMSRSQS